MRWVVVRGAVQVVEGREQDEALVDTIGQMMTGTPLDQIQKEGVAAHG